MDLTRAVRYRGFNLNTIQRDSVTGDLVGKEIQRISYHGVQGVGYSEKKAMADGHDVGDVFLDKRLIAIEGVLYGRTRAECFDHMRELVDWFTPTDAFESNRSNKGYQPFDFYLPTRKTGPTDYPSGLIHQMMLARPTAQPKIEFASDVHGGPSDQALALKYSVVLDCKQPYIFNYEYTTISVAGAAAGSGTVRNRGNRPAPWEMRLIIPPRFNGTSNGNFIIAPGFGTRVTFTIPSSDKQLDMRYDSYHKVVSVNGGLRMDLLSFSSGFDHGQVASGNTGYAWRRTGTKTLMPGSYIRFRDTFA